MKKFNMLKKIKLNTPQMFLVILVILVIVFGFTNLFCNTLGLGKKCNIKENYAVRTSDCATGPACSSSTGDYADIYGNNPIPHSHNPADYTAALSADPSDEMKTHVANLEHAIAHGWLNADGSESAPDTYFTELEKSNYGSALSSAKNVSASGSII